VEEDGARLCEMWFRIDRAAEYDDMLSWLGQRGVRVGLHHWGLAQGNYKTNLATNNEEIRQESIQQIKDTINVGASIKCAYVNAHPGAAQLEISNMETGDAEPAAGAITDPEESGALFLLAAGELQSYAQEKGVLLTLETLPGRETYQAHNRSRLYDPQNVPLAVMSKLGAQGNWLANDITHTLAALSAWETDEAQLEQQLLAFTRAVEPFTRLLHVNTLRLPHDGADSHDGITEIDFLRPVSPDKAKIMELLSIFKERGDVFVIPEPRTNMQNNWRALQELVKSISR
jgi:hypothetical protein